MKKLTLSADEKVIDQAKELAERNGTSVSAMFARVVRVMAHRGKRPALGPLTRRASGLISLPRGKSDREVLEDALLEEHGLDR